MTANQSRAMRLADALELHAQGRSYPEIVAAFELRRLHAMNAELLEALEYALEFLQDWEDLSGGPFARKARAAIAKSQGDQHEQD